MALQSDPRPLAQWEPLTAEQAERLWTTALALAAMESLQDSWSVSEEGSPLDVTLVDRSQRWLERQAATHEGVAAVMDSVMAAARAHDHAWGLRQDCMMGSAKKIVQVKDMKHPSPHQPPPTAPPHMHTLWPLLLFAMWRSAPGLVDEAA